MPNEFVFALHDIPTSGETIKKNEIGIIRSKSANGYKVNFVVGNRTIDLDKDSVEEFDPKETGDLYPKKVCNVCHRLLNTDEFQKNQTGLGDRTIRRPSCNDCRKIIDGTPMQSAERAQWQAKKPDMEIFECPICHKITVPGLTSKVVLDHDHDSGNGRGWICDSCNTGIGRFKDDPELLNNAISYLKNQSK